MKARPPPVERTDPNYPGNNRKYSDLLLEQIPRSESLLDCLKRTEPLWQFLERDLANGNNVLVCAHANTLRGLAKIIDGKGMNNLSFLPLLYPNCFAIRATYLLV